MPRCINNCHNLESFWKNWHASFNKWLVRYTFFDTLYPSYFCNLLFCHVTLCNHIFIRYVYIPLGGSQKKLLNVWVVFTFVAVWHDLEWYISLSKFFQKRNIVLYCHSPVIITNFFPWFQEASFLGVVDVCIFYTRNADKISS